MQVRSAEFKAAAAQKLGDQQLFHACYLCRVVHAERQALQIADIEAFFHPLTYFGGILVRVPVIQGGDGMLKHGDGRVVLRLT